MLCGNKWKTCDCPWFNYRAVEADRLNHMNIPEPVRIILGQGVQGAPAHLRERERNPNPRNPALTYQQEMDRRQAQERADEDLARRLQQQTFDEPRVNAGPNIWGIATAGQQFLNDNLLMQNANGFWGNMLAAGRLGPRRTPRRPRPPTNTDVDADQNDDGSPGGVDVGYGADSGPPGSRGVPVASTMAGLAPDGSRRGADRVGGWLQHVEEDPNEPDM